MYNYRSIGKKKPIAYCIIDGIEMFWPCEQWCHSPIFKIIIMPMEIIIAPTIFIVSFCNSIGLCKRRFDCQINPVKDNKLITNNGCCNVTPKILKVKSTIHPFTPRKSRPMKQNTHNKMCRDLRQSLIASNFLFWFHNFIRIGCKAMVRGNTNNENARIINSDKAEYFPTYSNPKNNLEQQRFTFQILRHAETYFVESAA